MKILLTILSFLSACYLSANEQIESNFPLRKPNYRPGHLEYYPEGGISKVVYVAPVNGSEVAIKEAYFYPSGTLKEEIDLLTLPSGSLYHGVAMGYYEKGTVAKRAHYEKGLLEGEYLLFYPSSQLKEKCFYHLGKKEGNFIAYYPEGGKKEEGFYNAGKKEGEFTTYYEDGSRATLTQYAKGLPQGKALEWHPQSTQIKSTSHYLNGLLNADGKSPAFMAYSPTGELVEVQDFRLGKPQGTHLKYHAQGKVAYRMPYVNGLKEGMEEFFSTSGKLLGGGKFHRGLPVGRHYLHFENDKLAKEALYNDKGLLLQSICEYHENGVLKKSYTPFEDSFEGAYKEWDSSSQLLVDRFYLRGRLTGDEKLFYPTGAPQLIAHYENGNKTGSYQKWHDNGKIQVEATFVEGKRDGLFQEWNSEGRLIFKATYLKGELSGPLQHYYTDVDQLKESAFFLKGKKEGVEEKFYPSGQKQSSACYKEGLLEGEYITYFPQGKCKSSYFFIKGLPQGAQKEFFPPQGSDEPSLARLLNYHEGNLEGEQYLYYPHGKPQAYVRFCNGVMDGMKRNWDSEGNLFEEGYYCQGKVEGRYYQKNQAQEEAITYFKEGKKEGLHEVFYPAEPGQKRLKKLDATYVNDLLEGEVSEYDNRGFKASSAFFKEGKKEGMCTLYAADGVVLAAIPFHNDKKEGKARFYYPSGKLYRESEFKNDLRHGNEKFYSETGALLSSAHYVEEKLEGIFQEWDENGQLLFEGHYVGGLKDGKFQKSDIENNTTIVSLYEKDKLISKQKVEKR